MKKIKNLFKRAVPSIITGAADNDPSGISTYSIIGAQFGYRLNWLMILATPMLIAVEAMCARLSDVTRKGLTALIKIHFPPWVVFFAISSLSIANIATIGADLSAMSEVMGLIFGTESFIYIILVVVAIWFIVFFGNFRLIQKYLLWLLFFLFSYIFAAFLSKPDWGQVLRETFFPTFRFDFGFFAAATALLGTTISPYLFFWESSEEVESRQPRYRLLKKASREDAIVAPGFIASNIISMFIMIATGTVLFSNGVVDIKDAAQAAQALEPFAGPFAKYIFAIGILGAGFLAVPVLATTTAYAIAEAFGWRDSLSDKLSKAKGFYTVILFSIIIGMSISFIGIDPIKALFYSQVLVGILTPFLLLLILLLANNKRLLGEHTNGWFDNFFGTLAVVTMTVTSIGFFWQLFR